MEDLNPEQKRAITSTSPHIVIIAGPGTGKTKTLIARIKRLISDKVPPEKILAITFTNKAADQIRYRSGGNEKIFIGTFHGLALNILNLNTQIITTKEQLKIVSRKKLNEISKAKNNFESNPEVEKYNKILVEKGLVDFDDLLLNLCKYLQENGVAFEHVLVDEFQDTNAVQYQILKLLNSKNCFTQKLQKYGKDSRNLR